MYNNGAALPVATAGLSFTATDSIWMTLAAFALVAAGSAIMRVIPRTEDKSVL